MAAMAARYLYLVRHGEALPDESGLTEAGRRQAEHLGERLRAAPLSVIHHSPLPRARQTAELIAGRLDGVPLRSAETAGDYFPYVPRRDELPPAFADTLLSRFAGHPDEELRRGPALAREALAEFTGPVEGAEPRHELVVTHNFLVAWLVRAAHDAPAWRWMGMNQGNASLTVIRYAPDRPASVLIHNDMGHLPEELRWTGFPPELRV
ncbi:MULTISPECIES: histidine phosphatase family protein [Streptomyces]|uniref:Histidine phosphatase family protein n=2 Tax=Streptomyces TaxID=1883 RepID=A0A3Q9FUG7_STRLT|nr:histidine phosphatase family protein [Streptomyces luteoverticillatus]AZQ72113.1 histidine phosphatase family protein [Streptomyces luteoverticillatus]